METVRVRAGPLCRGCMDFEKYGQDCMGNDCVTKQSLACCGLDPPFPVQQQEQRMM